MRRPHRILTIGLATTLAAAALPAGASAAAGNLRHPDGRGLLPGAQPSGGLGGDSALAAASGRARSSAAAARGFGGPTGGRETLAVNATPTRVTLFLIDWTGDCDDGDSFSATTRMPSMRLRRGTFSKRRTESEAYDDGVYTYVNQVRGKVTNGRARGTFRTVVIGRDHFGNEMWRCDTGAVRFSVPRAFAGRTDYGTPLILGVAADRRRVESVEGWWVALCDSRTATFAFGGLPSLNGAEIDAQGAFAGTVTLRADQPPWVHDIEAQVSGTLVGRRATGTWRAKATSRLVDTGEVVDTCAGETGFAAVR